MKATLPALLAACALALFPPRARAAETLPFAVGLMYPGVSLRWRASPRYAIDMRASAEGGVRALGVRGYRYGRPLGKWSPFLGVEGDWLAFDVDGVEGDGQAFVAFAGGDYFFHPRLSLQMDVGAGWLALKDQAAASRSDGVEFVINTGVNFHWGRSAAP